MTPAWWRAATFRSQIVISTMALTALGMVVVTIGLQVILHRTENADIQRVLEDRADSVIAAIESTSGPTLSVPNETLDPGVVVFEGQGRRVAGLPAPDLAQEVTSLSGADTSTTLNVREHARLLAVPFHTSSGAHGVVVVTELLEPYEQAGRYVLLACIGVGLIVVLSVGAMAQWATTRALRPVTQMAERATDWSEHDLGRRFELGPPTNEIAALGSTLDGLLERVAMTIRAEQRLTSELAHELRTPLAAIQGSADLALLRGGLDEEARTDLEQIAGSSRTMAETISTLLDLARDPEAVQQSATCRLVDVLETITALVPDGVSLADHTAADGIRIAAPRDLVVRAVSPVVENAVRHARSRVTLDTVTTTAGVDLHIADDGAGIDDAVRDALFDPGTTGPQGGTGLGLGIARRAARSIGGDVVVGETRTPHDAQGALFVVHLPRL